MFQERTGVAVAHQLSLGNASATLHREERSVIFHFEAQPHDLVPMKGEAAFNRLECNHLIRFDFSYYFSSRRSLTAEVVPQSAR